MSNIEEIVWEQGQLLEERRREVVKALEEMQGIGSAEAYPRVIDPAIWDAEVHQRMLEYGGVEFDDDIGPIHQTVFVSKQYIPEFDDIAYAQIPIQDDLLLDKYFDIAEYTVRCTREALEMMIEYRRKKERRREVNESKELS